MAIDALVKPFLYLPLFKGLKPIEITEIVRRADRVIYRPGDTIISEDQVGDAAIVIVSGEAVRTSSLEPGTAAEAIPEGSIVGELAMLVEVVHTSTIIARGNVKALRLSREDMHDHMLSDPRLAEHFSDQIANRLGQFLTDLQEVDSMVSDLTGVDEFEASSPLPLRAADNPAETAIAVH